MKEQSARRVANVVVGAAAAGAAFVVLRNPQLRRIAWGLAVVALTRKGPAWLTREVQQAWRETAPAGARTLS
jgi:hypothetical protein